MDDSFGNEAPGRYSPHVFKRKGKYLVVIDAAGAMVARLLDENRHELAEFDASSEEIRRSRSSSPAATRREALTISNSSPT